MCIRDSFTTVSARKEASKEAGVLHLAETTLWLCVRMCRGGNRLSIAAVLRGKRATRFRTIDFGRVPPTQPPIKMNIFTPTLAAGSHASYVCLCDSGVCWFRRYSLLARSFYYIIFMGSPLMLSWTYAYACARAFVSACTNTSSSEILLNNFLTIQ